MVSAPLAANWRVSSLHVLQCVVHEAITCLGNAVPPGDIRGTYMYMYVVDGVFQCRHGRTCRIGIHSSAATPCRPSAARTVSAPALQVFFSDDVTYMYM